MTDEDYRALLATAVHSKDHAVSIADHRDIVAALREVPGVAEADVEPDGEGEGLGLLRLGLAPGVDEVEVASAVGRLLRERFGLGVDAERVQLVEDMQTSLDDPDIEEDEDDEAIDRFRPTIRRMHIISSGLQVAAEVTLAVGDRSALGHAEGTATQSGVQRAVATATLHAVEDLLDGRARQRDIAGLEASGVRRRSAQGKSGQA